MYSSTYTIAAGLTVAYSRFDNYSPLITTLLAFNIAIADIDPPSSSPSEYNLEYLEGNISRGSSFSMRLEDPQLSLQVVSLFGLNVHVSMLVERNHITVHLIFSQWDVR